MTPRPRKATDDQIFEAALRVMSRLGPTRWTLGDVAKEAGLTAGALVQRFGSKRALQITLYEKFADGTGAMFASLRASHRSPLATIRAYAECIAQMAATPHELAHHLEYLQLDLTDPDFHRSALAQARSTRAELRKLLDEAVAAGELTPLVKTSELARAIEVAVSGSLMTWGFYQEGSAVKWIRKDLDMILEMFAVQENKKR
jgi:AcrR family transcriptional regulator